MSTIKNDSQGRKGNPIGTLKTILGGLAMNKHFNYRSILAFLIIGFLAMLFTPVGGLTGPLDHWTSRASGSTTPIYDVVYGNGTFVAVGNSDLGGKTIRTSTDGITWTPRSSGSAATLYGITYGKGIFVAVGIDGIIRTSTDAASWTIISSPTNIPLYGVTYGNGIFVAVGGSDTPPPGSDVVLTSPDGNSWTKVRQATGGWLNSIAYNNGVFVAVGAFGTILRSTDGTNWTEAYIMSGSVFPGLHGITFGIGSIGKFVVVGHNGTVGTIHTSPDGITWTEENSGTPNTLNGIAVGNGILVSAGDGGTIIASNNGTNWVTISSGTAPQLLGINYGNGTFVAVGWGGTILQSDLVAPQLTIGKSGTGTGTVRSTPFGINCGADCDEAYDNNSIVTLTAAPDTGSYFGGWIGDCVSQALTCKVTMDAAKNVTATFTSGTPPENTWAKTYGGSNYDNAYSIQQTSDGGYIVAGETYSFGAGNEDIWVLKLNADGTVAWQKTYGGSGENLPWSIQQTSDGGYIVAGFTSFGVGGGDIWVLKLNADGSVAWQKTYGGLSYDVAYSIQQTSDGGYIVAGYTNSFGTGGDIWVLKLNADGSIAWQKTYGGSGSDEPYSIQQTSDGGYIVAGLTGSFGAGGDIWVLKLNADGSIAWQKTYGGSGSDEPYSIQQTSDGGYIVAGLTGSFGAGGDIWVLKLNADGSIAWQKTYGGLGYDYGTSIQQTSDGGYIVAGLTGSFGAGGGDLWVLKLDSNGNIYGCPGGLIGVTTVSGTDTSAVVTNTEVIGQDTNIIPQISTGTESSTSVIPSVVCIGLDIDADGINDAWEILYFGSITACNPNADPDGDGLTNLEEYRLGTNPRIKNTDTDGDGYSDAREVALGTNPNDPSSYPTAYVPDAERAALIDLYNSTNGSGWTNKDNWLSTTVSECNWYGVTCTGNHVTQLYPYGNNLVGTIPSSIGNLTYLEILSLFNNKLTGNIPASLGSLTNLGYLALYNNQLTGSIPTELGNLTNLTVLTLDINQLTGNIPPELGSLNKLQNLELSGNQLMGSIPTQLGNLTNLTVLSLFANNLTGIIPDLSSLTNLSLLYLSDNQLTGPIPAWLGSLTKLQQLDLSWNQLTGSIPTELGYLTNLTVLRVGHNQLTGSIPTQLGNLTNLVGMNLQSNSLTGAIPVSLKNLTQLTNNGSDLRWNALYTTDNTLRTFLNSKQTGGDWESTQTIAPTNLTATVLSSTSVQLTWTPIIYTGDTGGYEIWKGTPGPGGTVWSLEYTTPNKSANTYTVGGLTPGMLYDFKLRTVTNPHANNQNTVYSEYTLPTSGDEFTGDLIDPTVWADLEVFKRINNGVLESQIRRHGSNGNNYLLFYNPSTVNSFHADVTVKAYENNSSYPYASLFGRVYRGVYNTILGDVIGHVGIGHNGTQLEGFWSISRCTTANCSLPNEYDQICSGLVDNAFIPLLNTTYTLSFSWNGSPTFTFGIGDGVHNYTRVISSSNCTNLPANADSPEVNSRAIGTRVSQINGPNEGGYIAATFDNVYVNGSPYDSFDSSTIDLTKWWGSLELVSMVDNGELLSELTQRGVNGGYNMSFVNSQAILGFEADLKVVEFQNNGARPLGRLYAALYNDGTPGSGSIGDVIASIGILEQSSSPVPPALPVPQAFYAVSRCLAPNCNLPGEYEFLTSGIFGPVGLNEMHKFSLSWDGSQLTFGLVGSPSVSYFPPVPVAGPPKGRKGIGTRVTEISDSTEWAYVAASFDNVVVLSTGYPLTVTKSGTGNGTVTSLPPGIDCGSDCGEGYPSGTPVTLTATQAGGSFFAGWSGGGCSGTGSCLVTMDAVKSVTATFTIIVSPPPTIISITPNYGFVGTVDNFYMINGTGFLPGATVKLTKSGESDIIATIDAITSTQIRGRISLSVAAVGLWNVVVTNFDGQSGTLTNGFTVNLPGCPDPATPLTPSPGDGATGVLTNQTLSWAISAETDSYDVYFGTSTNPLFLGNVIGTSYALPTLNPNTTYYWKIVAKNNCGNSTSGSLWSFTTIHDKPLPPTLASPGNLDTGVSTSPTLRWNASNGATSYQLQVFRVSDMSVVFDHSGLSATSQALSGLTAETTYSWQVMATNGSGTSNWSDVWKFTTQPAYGVPFIGARGIVDPDNDLGENNGDGIDDAVETSLLRTSPTMKTLFVRPKKQTGAHEYAPWGDEFVALFPAKNPDGTIKSGFADIPPFTNAGIEIVVIGASGHLYEPFDHFDYDPGSDQNHPNVDILELVYKGDTAFGPGSYNYGHTFFYYDATVNPPRAGWSWDTKGYTPSTPGIHGYKTPEIYPFPLDNYIKEGAYQSIEAGQSPVVTKCPTTAGSTDCQKKSPMNVNGTDAVNGLPDGTVEFNVIAYYDSGGKIVSINTPFPATGYDGDAVRRRTIVHEMGHALLTGLDQNDHCQDPKCIMNGEVVDWQLHDFGPGDCIHKPGGSRDIRASGIIHNSVHGLQSYSISGTVTSGGTGLANVVMNGLPSNPVTNASGFYSASVTSGWNGTVTPTLTGYSFSPSSNTYSNIAANQTQNYTATAQTFTISGTVTLSGSGLANVVMTGLPNNPVTNASGVYSGTVNYGWSGTVTPTLAGYAFTPSSASYASVTANQTQNYTASYAPPNVTGITPNSGTNNGSVNITNLAGTNFRSGASVKLTMGGTDIPGTSVVVASSTRITCTFNLTNAATGQWNVVVTNADGQSGALNNGFTVRYPAPTVTGITPSSGNHGTTVSITNLAGTNFRSGATVKLTRSGYNDIPATSVVVVSSIKITCSFVLPSNAATGRWNVVVTNPDNQSYTLSNSFRIN